MLRFRCPKCKKELTAHDSNAGRVVKCQCGQAMAIPSQPLTASAAPGGQLMLEQRSPQTAANTEHESTISGNRDGIQAQRPKLVPGSGSPPLGQSAAPRPIGHEQLKAPMSSTPVVKGVPVAEQGRGTGFLTFAIAFLAGGIVVGAFLLYKRWSEPAPLVLAPTISQADEKKAGPDPTVPSPFGLPPQIPSNDNANTPAVAANSGQKQQPPIPLQQKSNVDSPAKNDDPAPPASDVATKPQPKDDTAEKKGPGASPKKENEPAPALQTLISALRDGKGEDKLSAIRSIASLGEKASAASHALCEAAMSPNRELSREALLALEKVNPDLYGPVFTLVIDGNPANHLKASRALRNLGSKAKPAAAVLIQQIRNRRNDLEKQGGHDFFAFAGGHPVSITRVVSEHLFSLASISPEEPDSLQTIIDSTMFTIRLSFGFGDTRVGPFRQAGVELLGGIAEEHPPHREKILAKLEALLQDSVETVSTTNEFLIRGKLAEIEAIGNAMLRCGEEAHARLIKKTVPQLKELEFHKDASVRSAAKALRTRIEAGPSKSKIAFPVDDEITGPSFERRYPVSMIAGKTYTIDMRSADFDAFLRLTNPLGVIVAQDDDSGGGLNARIAFECAETGHFTIIASPLTSGATGRFTLSVREE
jgi:hypothetical protein